MSRSALVVGGTGQTGPLIVSGLIERGYDVVVMHSGRHEVEETQSTEHIHCDVHFLEGKCAARWRPVSGCWSSRCTLIAHYP